MSLKEAVKRECRLRNITQAELAEQLGMKPSNFNNQINRDETVQLGLIKKICSKLNISIGKLLNESSKEDNENSHIIFKQLQTLLNDGDENTVDLIMGKIAREYLRIIEKKNLQ
jgi:transcriptional regulator with XRE-family HTH domain